MMGKFFSAGKGRRQQQRTYSSSGAGSSSSSRPSIPGEREGSRLHHHNDGKSFEEGDLPAGDSNDEAFQRGGHQNQQEEGAASAAMGKTSSHDDDNDQKMPSAMTMPSRKEDGVQQQDAEEPQDTFEDLMIELPPIPSLLESSSRGASASGGSPGGSQQRVAQLSRWCTRALLIQQEVQQDEADKIQEIQQVQLLAIEHAESRQEAKRRQITDDWSFQRELAWNERERALQEAQLLVERANEKFQQSMEAAESNRQEKLDRLSRSTQDTIRQAHLATQRQVEFLQQHTGPWKRRIEELIAKAHEELQVFSLQQQQQQQQQPQHPSLATQESSLSYSAWSSRQPALTTVLASPLLDSDLQSWRHIPFATATTSTAGEMMPTSAPIPAGASVQSSWTTSSSVRHPLECPITKDVMSDPVLAADGHTYERRSIEAYFSQLPPYQRPVSHVTGMELSSTTLVPNLDLMSLCREEVERRRLLCVQDQGSSSESGATKMVVPQEMGATNANDTVVISASTVKGTSQFMPQSFQNVKSNGLQPSPSPPPRPSPPPPIINDAPSEEDGKQPRNKDHKDNATTTTEDGVAAGESVMEDQDARRRSTGGLPLTAMEIGVASFSESDTPPKGPPFLPATDAGRKVHFVSDTTLVSPFPHPGLDEKRDGRKFLSLDSAERAKSKEDILKEVMTSIEDDKDNRNGAIDNGNGGGAAVVVDTKALVARWCHQLRNDEVEILERPTHLRPVHLDKDDACQLFQSLLRPDDRGMVQKVKHIDWSGCHLNDASIAGMVEITRLAYQQYPESFATCQLSTLNLSDNPIGEEGANELLDFVLLVPTLVHVHLHGTQNIQEETLTMIAGVTQRRRGESEEDDDDDDEFEASWALAMEQGTEDSLSPGDQDEKNKPQQQQQQEADASIGLTKEILSVVWASHPGLKRLDLRGRRIGDAGVDELCVALQSGRLCLELERLELQLNNISLRGTKALSQLLCHGVGGNSSLDVRARKQQQHLPGSPSLVCLQLDDNKIGAGGAVEIITSLDENEKLRELYMGRNGIGNDGASTIAARVSPLKKVSALQDLSLVGNEIGVEGAIAIVKACPTLVRLHLGDNKRIGNDENLLLGLANAMKNHEHLEYLSLWGCDLSFTAMHRLMTARDQRATWMELDLEWNEAKRTVDDWCQLLRQDQVEELSIRTMTAVAVEGVEAQAEAWPIEVGDEGAKKIAEAFFRPGSGGIVAKLRKLDLSSCDIGDAGVESMVLAAQWAHRRHLDSFTTCQLSHVDLSHNRITRESGNHLLDFLLLLPSVTRFDLEGNKTLDGDTIATINEITQMHIVEKENNERQKTAVDEQQEKWEAEIQELPELPSHRRERLKDAGVSTIHQELSLLWSGETGLLRRLDLSRRGIGDEGVEELFRALQKNSSSGLESLELQGNGISSRGAKAISSYLGGSPEQAPALLLCLQLDGNKLGAAGAVLLSTVLERTSHLRVLCLGQNGIGDEGTVALAWALGERRKAGRGGLVELSLVGNDIGRHGVAAVANHLVRSENAPATLERLHLGDNLRIGQDPCISQLLLDALAQNTSVTYLSLWRCGLMSDAVQVLQAEMDRFKAEERTLELDLEWNDDDKKDSTLRTNSEIKVALLGNSGVGKSTLINVLLGDTCCGVGPSRTTTGVNYYHLVTTATDKTKTSSEMQSIKSHPPSTPTEDNSSEAITENDTLESAVNSLEERAYDIHVRDPIFPVHQNTHLVLVDTPGINRVNTRWKCLEFFRNKWHTFDAVIVVMHGGRVADTAVELNLMRFVKENLDTNRQIPVIVVCNKFEDMEEDRIGTLRTHVEDIFEVDDREKALELLGALDNNLPLAERMETLSPVFLPMSVETAFLSCAVPHLDSQGLSRLPPRTLNKLGNEWVGKWRWEELSPEEKISAVEECSGDPNFLEDLGSGNLDKLIIAIQQFVGREQLVQTEFIERQPPQQPTNPTVRNRGNLGSEDWQLLPSMSEGRSNFAAVSVGDHHIVVLGGGSDRIDALRSVECFDARTNEWHRLPDMSVAREGCAAAVVDGDKIVIAGGRSDSGGYLQSAECFDFARQTWKALPSMRHARAECSAVSIGDRVYMIGGYTGSRRGALDTMEYFDIRGGLWYEIVLESKRSSCASSVLFGSLLVVAGGWAPRSGGGLTTVESFSTDTRTWTKLPDLPRKLYGCCGVAHQSNGNRFLVVGGGLYLQDDVYNMVVSYNYDTGVWSELPPMNSSRQGCCAVMLGNQLLAIGGWDGNRRLSSMEQLDLVNVCRDDSQE